MHMPRVISSLVPFLLGAATLHAQAQPDEVRLRSNCRLALQVIKTGQPAPQTEWALRQVDACGLAAQGSAL